MESKTIFDRIAIAFGAMVIGGAGALVAALPLFYIIGLFSIETDGVGELLFLKMPILFGIISALVALISPVFAADWIGRVWQGLLYLWRVIVGS